jgi:hypothetical protein
MPLNAALVLTTIGDPVLLDSYHANFLANHHLEQIRVIVIPDRKTPAACFERCARLRASGLPIECPTIEQQECFLRKLAFPTELIPYDSDNRRNVGYLMALAQPIDFLISIDDDNFCPSGEDFFAQHAVVCEDKQSLPVVETSDGWFNICQQLTTEPSAACYPRGFPYFARHKQETVRQEQRDTAIRINAGLWLQEPDLDALSWLSTPVRITAFPGTSVVLGPRTWSPVNTQNTALHRKAIPSYYFVRMGFPLSGMRIDRYGDIFSGYFSQACAKSLGDAVRVGTPIALHARNSHNYLRDATQELACICLLEDILPWLQELRLPAGDYLEAYESLSEALDEAACKFHGFIWTDEAVAFLRAISRSMRQWLKACRQLSV